MNYAMRTAMVGTPLILAVFGFAVVDIGRGQVIQSPVDLIKFLTYQSVRPVSLAREFGAFSCGSADAEGREDRAAAASLVKLGSSAIPSLEGAFDSLEEQGRRSEFSTGAAWLFYAYAKIEGPTALLRLRRMISNPGLNFLQPSLDYAVALSLGLTSYVSSSRQIPAGEMIYCDGEMPRDTLDELVLAWERNNRSALEASLGPNARVALQSLLDKGRSWAAVRADLWRGKSGSDVAMGYRFDIAGRWAKPAETLEQEQEEQAVVDVGRRPVNLQFDTLLKGSSGGDCGRHAIKFLRSQSTGSFVAKYLVDNSDLGDLLRSIAACAARTQ
jgi:hypothetical protein